MNPLHPLITVDPLRRGGRPCVRDLHIGAGDVLGWLAQGQSPEQIQADYPELTAEDIRACMAWAADRSRLAVLPQRDEGVTVEHVRRIQNAEGA